MGILSWLERRCRDSIHSFSRALVIVLGDVLVASVVRAWRAARINPLRALRHQ